MPVIEIELTDEVYAALNEWRRTSTQPRPNPANPEQIIVEPVFPSVEAYLHEVIQQNVSSVLTGRYELAPVRQIREQMQALENQLKEAQAKVVAVRSQQAKKAEL